MTNYTIKTFNTGRLYTESGQRIAWVSLPGDMTYFIDIDRDIEGVITHTCETSEDVMAAYDRGWYQLPTWEVTQEWRIKAYQRALER